MRSGTIDCGSVEMSECCMAMKMIVRNINIGIEEYSKLSDT